MIFSSPGLKPMAVVGSLADEGFRVLALHGCFEKEDVVHGVIARGGSAVGFGVGLRVCGAMP